LIAALTAACGEDPVVDDTPDPEIAPFVGLWDAEVFTVTADAPPNQEADLLLNDGSFTINVEGSGTYTATLVFGIPLVEIGQLAVNGSFVTLQPNGGDPATSEFTFLQPDYLRLVGPTEFDFNLDNIPEAAEALIELRRR